MILLVPPPSYYGAPCKVFGHYRPSPLDLERRRLEREAQALARKRRFYGMAFLIEGVWPH